jgi:hypothetical protein
MKTIIFLILCSFTLSVSYAQPNFTTADMPNIGDNDTIMILQYHPLTNNLDTETGNSFNWNFSSLPFNVQNFIDIDSFRVKQHFVSKSFPNAAIEEYKTGVTGQTVNLYSFSNDTLYVHRLGDISNNWALSPLASIAFPITFNNSSVINSKIYTGTGFTLLVGERKTTTLYDGFGTLNMPNGKSYNNVFRIKQIERDTNYVTNTVTSTTSYIWYKQGGQVPLLRLVYTGVSNLYFVFGSKANGKTSGINELKIVSNINIYPNPSKDLIQIQVNSYLLGSNYLITDQLGKILMTGKITSETISVDINKLNSGLYFFKIIGKNQESYKIVKE